MQARIAQDGEIERCFEAMRELRPHLTLAAFLERVERQRGQGYLLACIDAGQGPFPAAAGFRFLENLGWGKFLYVDDLATRSGERRKRYAETLFRFLAGLARQRGCDALHLDSGHHRFDAHAFYLRHGMRITGHHFSIDIEA